jgi:hypothetical protein
MEFICAGFSSSQASMICMDVVDVLMGCVGLCLEFGAMALDVKRGMGKLIIDELHFLLLCTIGQSKGYYTTSLCFVDDM